MPDAAVLERAEKPPVVERVICPFYGRHLAFASVAPCLVDQHGNQCALITSAYAPCAMEVAGEPSNWERCPRNPANNGTYIDPLRRRAGPDFELPLADTPASVAEKAKAARRVGPDRDYCRDHWDQQVPAPGEPLRAAVPAGVRIRSGRDLDRANQRRLFE